MKKLIAVLMTIMLLTGAALAEDFQSMTGLDAVQAKMDTGVTIDKVYYTDGYGFSISEFTTDDPETISRLWTALNKMTVKGKTNESITDWYPMIVLYLSDGTQAIVSFEANWLSLGAKGNYEIENGEEFWALTAYLVQQQAEKEKVITAWGETAAGGWEAAADPAVSDEVRALFDKAVNGLTGVNYVPAAYLGTQVVAGRNHAILCQATTVYPGAAPRWVIMYLYEDLNSAVTITDITDLNW